MTKLPVAKHQFTEKIIDVLTKHFGRNALDVFEASPLLGYLNHKTKAANRGSKARGAFANHYALYVIIEDYIKKGFFDQSAKRAYKDYEGARFSDLLSRQRQLPFGTKLQNHALNARLNDEFSKFYPSVEIEPIIRDLATQRYWVQEKLLLVTVRDKRGADCVFNIAQAVLEIIDAYVATKLEAFQSFISTCHEISEIGAKDPSKAIEFVISQLQPNVDARVFEIVSYAVLKAKYHTKAIWIGDTRETVSEQFLMLFKTGRTNANDGGIDFVMKPLGRFFQVTETIDVNKYFLDIDKVQRFPITFVVKSKDSAQEIREAIRTQAAAKYTVTKVVDSYMAAIEEIINVDDLISRFREVVKSNRLRDVMTEIVLQSKVEFNHGEEEDAAEEIYEDKA
jgi:hypothetical protein